MACGRKRKRRCHLISELVANSEKELAQLEQPLTDADYAASIEEWIEPVGQVETLERAALGRANMALENVVWVRTAFGGHPDVGLQIEEMPALAATHHAPVIEEQPSVELVDQLDMADATIPIFSVTEAPVGQVAPAEVGIVPADIANPLEQTAVEQASGEQTREEQTPGEQTREEQTREEQTRGKETRGKRRGQPAAWPRQPKTLLAGPHCRWPIPPPRGRYPSTRCTPVRQCRLRPVRPLPMKRAQSTRSFHRCRGASPKRRPRM